MNTQEFSSSNQNVISVGEWVLNLFLISIPIVNIIMLCVWAFGNGTNPSKANFAKAGLIWIAIAIAFYAVAAIFFFSAFSSGMN